jgi:hypothetical protein
VLARARAQKFSRCRRAAHLPRNRVGSACRWRTGQPSTVRATRPRVGRELVARMPQVVNVDALQGRAFGTPNAYQIRDRSRRDARSKEAQCWNTQHAVRGRQRLMLRSPLGLGSAAAPLSLGASRHGHTPLRGAALNLSFVARVRNDRRSPTGDQVGAEDIGQQARRAPQKSGSTSCPPLTTSQHRFARPTSRRQPAAR